MKKITKILFATMACTQLFSVSAAENNNWYMGGLYSAQDLSKISNDDRDFSTLGIIAGYQYNEYFFTEARYSKGVSGAGFNVSEQFDYSADINYQLSVLIKAAYPVTDTFNLYAIAGYAKTDIDQVGTTPVFTPETLEIIDSEKFEVTSSISGFTYGFGLSYELNNKFNIFADYQVLPDLESVPFGSDNCNSINVGFSYAF
ncbi:porin family protein [Lacimicrobium sp. SS2-24]|uniref:porin family protein n=1 Tax=Lacimicrobium sp. SS2-24 TaxID=2005569 RepID=UPI00143CB37F|nr:porin family protein [Lacimicrobium sp. SS2-24]